MSTENTVNYKVFLCAAGFEPEIRRITISQDISKNYFYLKQKLISIFPTLKDVQFTVSWKDREGDTVRICTDEELVIALNEMTNQEFKKIYVSTAPQQDNEGPVHSNVQCDGCDHAIQGFRYKCIVCLNFDLCADCERSQVHPDHPMIRIPLPMMLDEQVSRRFFLKIAKLVEHLYQASERWERKGRGDYSRGNSKREKRGPPCPAAVAAAVGMPLNQLFNLLGVPGMYTQTQEQPINPLSQNEALSSQQQPNEASGANMTDPTRFCEFLRESIISFLDPLGASENNRSAPAGEEAAGCGGNTPTKVAEPSQSQPQASFAQNPQNNHHENIQQHYHLAPSAFQTQQTPPTPQTPQAPPTSQTQQAPPTSQTQQAPITPQVQQSALPPQTQQTPLTPQTQQTPLTPQTQQTSLTPQTQQTPLTPQTQQAPLTPQTQQAPLMPQTQQAPLAPTPLQAPLTYQIGQVTQKPKESIFSDPNTGPFSTEAQKYFMEWAQQRYDAVSTNWWSSSQTPRAQEQTFEHNAPAADEDTNAVDGSHRRGSNTSQQAKVSTGSVGYLLNKTKEDSPVLDNSWTVIQEMGDERRASGDCEMRIDLDSSGSSSSPLSDHEEVVIQTTESGQISVDDAMDRLRSMQFNDDGGWLRALVEQKNGNVADVLEFLTPIPKPSHN